ncbi:hypothetical protein HMI01_29430 [Halolactibacillus miurensis]|uniref:Uncharacterized protein n=1 Tax=Halolactibacillus miurensis TaxID=306541 RepID=A0A1I6U292_9BACI|nr:hypothetical protein [Halolactibacillus miurensis]GEM05955.1 hypothetical protein HMI01_29430 [Halolactibacillus miurensis]SFS95573.1 hypothetical protein SAMN05421668_1218 [Halolactibacillus miurensis]
MREYYLYEIEASEKPIMDQVEWQTVNSLTSDRHKSLDDEVLGYGEIGSNKYVALYRKTNNEV